MMDPLDEWKELSTPSGILKRVYIILKEHGFQVALQYIRYLFRGSWKMRSVLNDKSYKKTGHEKLKGLTKRYLTVKAAKKQIEKAGA